MRHESFLICICAILSFQLSQAKAEESLKVELQNFLVVENDGGEVLQETDEAQPGDVILYRAEFRNQSGGPLTNLRPSLPIPDILAYLEETVTPQPDRVLVEGNETLSFEDWKESQQSVRSFEWHLPELSEGEIFVVELRALFPAE
ncbi:MAG: hypothetical protein JJT75_05180 [Opitutales bacterium]|nr:hypothetical protein [Opitutales bacterium]MCH8540288.1 hypothetical protein [Opitutales bacterium]